MKVILTKFKSCYDCHYSYLDYEKESGNEDYRCDKTGSIIADIESINQDCPLEDIGKISDGYHTFDELYYHRMILFSIICNQNKDKAWKSWLHADGTMYPDYFIVGITTQEGDYTYHYHKDYWDKFNVPELERAHEWDGHQPSDIERLCSLL